MLEVSTRVDYGVQLLRQLGRAGQHGPMPLAAVARQLHLPYRYLAQVASRLRAAGLVESFEGARGGYRLRAPLSRISLGTVIAALEPKRRLVRCLRDGATCNCTQRGSVQGWWRQLDRRFNAQLHAITLEP